MSDKMGKKRNGVSSTPAYACWNSMRHRCTSPKAQYWKLYGGRGISIDPRWSEFSEFLKDMGERPPGMTLDRINNDGNYEPGNCRWATPKTQARNTRTNRRLKIDGITAAMVEHAERLGVNYHTLVARINKTGSANPPPKRTHCVWGHPFSGENLGFTRSSRVCRTCSRSRAKETSRKMRMEKKQLSRRARDE